MKHMIMALCLIATTGCYNPPPQVIQQPGRDKTIIIDGRRPAPAPQPPPPAPRPKIEIEIRPNTQCNRHHHCGKCDVCRRNGWVKIEIK